jgi:quercetin dioxygenase-like cupin family protein
VALKNYRVALDELPWKTSPAGVRFKAYEGAERRLRLLEFGRDLDHPGWCTTGHVGYLLEGEMEVEFDDRIVTFRAGDALVFPAGEADRHRPRALTDRVRMIFLEETAATSPVDSNSHL